MTAAWVDDLDQPVAYWLTDAGWAATGPSTLTLTEASTSSELAPAYVARLVRLGYVDGVEVDGQWLVDGASLAASWSAGCPLPRCCVRCSCEAVTPPAVCVNTRPRNGRWRARGSGDPSSAIEIALASGIAAGKLRSGS